MASNDGTSNSSSLPRGLLGRRGTPAGRGARLPSFRAPRDLTLGGVQKKTFVPNIPARRNKEAKTELDASQSGPTSLKTKAERHKEEQQKSTQQGRGHGRGRGRGQGEMIQSHSIFEQGPGAPALKHTGTSYGTYGGGSSGTGERTLKQEKKDSMETMKVLDDLLRDDFVSDTWGSSSDAAMMPVTLPLTGVLKTSLKEDIKSDVKVKSEFVVTGEPMNTLDSDSEVKSEPPGSSHRSLHWGGPQSVAELFQQIGDSEEGEMLFFQLPDVLPGDPHLDNRHQEWQTGDIKVKQEKSADIQSDEDGVRHKTVLSSMSDFEEGHIGKLQIRKSGCARLLLGNMALDVELGTPAGFLQDVVTMQTTEDSGDISVLGHLQHKLVCLPNFEALLQDT